MHNIIFTSFKSFKSNHIFSFQILLKRLLSDIWSTTITTFPTSSIHPTIKQTLTTGDQGLGQVNFNHFCSQKPLIKTRRESNMRFCWRGYSALNRYTWLVQPNIRHPEQCDPTYLKTDFPLGQIFVDSFLQRPTRNWQCHNPNSITLVPNFGAASIKDIVNEFQFVIIFR